MSAPRDDRKRPASAAPDQEPGGKRGPGADGPIVLVRVACPVEKSGPVIGKGGEVIRSIRDTTGARVKLDDSARGVPERAIVIHSPDRRGEPTCAAQDALDRVITRIFEPDEGEEGKSAPERVELVLLLDRVYMGIIVGKGGENVNRIRTQSACTVQIQPKGHGSILEGPDEETIVIIGPYAGVRSAARAILDRVREGVQRDHQPSPSTLAIAHTGRGGPLPGPGGHHMQETPPPFMPGAPPAPPAGPHGPPIHTQYKLLVPDSRVGSIIGKGGDRLKTLREQSRAEVKVDRSVEGSNERLVSCSSWEPPEHEYCAAAEGLMMCANRVVMDKTAVDEQGKVVLRVLAPSNQMGAVVGMQGRIIKQVSMDTGAQLVILPGQMMSKLGGADEEILEITGHPDQVMEATRIATMLLRGAMIRQQQANPLVPPPQVAQQFAPPAPAPAPGYAPAPAPGQYAPPAAPPPQYNYQQPGQPGQPGQQYAPAPAPAGAPYDVYSAAAPQPGGPAPYAPPPQPSSDPYATYYATYGTAPPPAQGAPPPGQQYAPSGYAPYSEPAQSQGPPPVSGYSSSYPAPAPAPTAYNYPPPATAPSSGHSGGGMGPPPANPAPGTLHNPNTSTAGMAPGMSRITFSIPTAHVGTLLGARGSNISAIRLSSGARIKLSDNQPGASEREVEISGQASQCSLALAAIQTLVSTGKMPANIPH